jgi:molecular chaperone HscB
VSPLARAHYLLKLENLTLEESNIELEPEFLMRIMDINERLSDDTVNEQVFPTDIAIEMRREIDNHMKQLSIALNQMDMSQATDILARLQYFNNINDKLTELEIKHGFI